MTNKLYCVDAIEFLSYTDSRFRMMFADPPDNINLGYAGYKDKTPDEQYRQMMASILHYGTKVADVLWLSFNPIHIPLVGHLTHELLQFRTDWVFKACVQTFTFGQHNHRDLGICHRPLYRYMREGTQLYPDAIRVPSWRQRNGDKRADQRGRVPGDVVNEVSLCSECLPMPVMSDKDIERFLSKIDRKEDKDCWEWKAGKREGYGRFRLGDNLYVASRVMWRLTHSDPAGSFVCHTCDNPGCCNPNHLFIGSAGDNNVDKENKGRGKHPKGETNGLSKLTDVQVAEIYMSTDKARDLATKYNVTDVCINQIRDAETWTHVTSKLNMSDVLNIPRVTGNSKQRRSFSPTQLNELLYERCIRLCCAKGDTVLDPFAGSGTLGRVAERCGVNSVMLEISRETCDAILADQPDVEEVQWRK